MRSSVWEDPPQASAPTRWRDEEPLEIRLALTLEGRRAPSGASRSRCVLRVNDDELAAGFLFTEGIVRRRDDIEGIGPCGPPAPNGLINVVRVELAPEVVVDLGRLERHFYTSSSCGVCGKASLDAVAVSGRYDVGAAQFAVTPDILSGLPAALRARQDVFEETGGLHASGLFGANGHSRACARTSAGITRSTS